MSEDNKYESSDQFSIVGDRECSECHTTKPLDHEHYYLRQDGSYRKQCITCILVKQSARNEAKQATYLKLLKASKNTDSVPAIKPPKGTPKFVNPRLQSMYEFWLTTKVG